MFTQSLVLGASPPKHRHPCGALFQSRSVYQAPPGPGMAATLTGTPRGDAGPSYKKSDAEKGQCAAAHTVSWGWSRDLKCAINLSPSVCPHAHISGLNYRDAHEENAV